MGFPRTLIILLAAGILTGCAAGNASLSPDQFRDLAATTLTGEIPEIEITGTDSLFINLNWKEFTVIAEIEEEYEAYLNKPRRLGKILAGMVQEFLDYDFSSVEPRPLEDQYIVPVFLRYDIIEQLATGNDGEETTTESFLVTEYAPGLYLTIVYYKDRRFSLIKNFIALQREMEPAQMYRWATGNIEGLIENDFFIPRETALFITGRMNRCLAPVCCSAPSYGRIYRWTANTWYLPCRPPHS
ncbi:MAG: hypothetical protein LUE26_11875 [Alistipes sp.]|nr:hypothetical protein [Alistipes sp.]